MNQLAESKSRRGVAVYELNPFLETLVSSGKELQEVGFVRLYTPGMRALRGLTSAGTKVFEVLYLEVQKTLSQGKIRMSFASVDQASNPMGLATYKRGMSELIAKGFLAATPVQGWYWLNPDYMWNGDRLADVLGGF